MRASILNLLALPLLAFALPAETANNNTLTARQEEIPDAYLYMVESWSGSCGDTDVVSRKYYGTEGTLAACTSPGGDFFGPQETTKTVRFSFRDDGKAYKWKLFDGQDCTTQHSEGTAENRCVTAPEGVRLNALIVYT